MGFQSARLVGDAVGSKVGRVVWSEEEGIFALGWVALRRVKTRTLLIVWVCFIAPNDHQPILPTRSLSSRRWEIGQADGLRGRDHTADDRVRL